MSDKFSEAKYDERQTAVRGRAFKWGFITLIVTFVAYMYGLESWSWMEPTVGCAMCLLAGIGVFAVISLYKGAYHWITENAKISYLVWLIAGGLNLADVIIGKDIFDGAQLGVGAMNLEAAIMFFAMAAADIAARIRERRSEEGEE